MRLSCNINGLQLQPSLHTAILVLASLSMEQSTQSGARAMRYDVPHPLQGVRCALDAHPDRAQAGHVEPHACVRAKELEHHPPE